MSHVHWIGYPSGLQAAMCDGMWYLSFTWMNYLIRGFGPRVSSSVYNWILIMITVALDFIIIINPSFSTFTPSPGHRYLLGWASGVGRSKKTINLKLTPLKYVVHKNRRYPPRPEPTNKERHNIPPYGIIAAFTQYWSSLSQPPSWTRQKTKVGRCYTINVYIRPFFLYE